MTMELLTPEINSRSGVSPQRGQAHTYSNGTGNGSCQNGNRLSPQSLSPGSISGQSSSSSLNIVDPMSTGHIRKNVSVQFRKVLIAEERTESIESTNDDTKHRPPSPLSTMSAASSSNRCSLFQISSEKRAKKVRFFINNDRFFKGATIAVSAEKFRTFDKLLEHLTRIMRREVTLPNGVRYIFAIDGKLMDTIEDLQHGGNYISSSIATFKKLDYLKLAQDADLPSGMVKSGMIRSNAFKQNGHSKTFGAAGTKSQSENTMETSPKCQIKPKIIAVLRNGIRPRKAIRVLLNHRNTKSFDNILADLTNIVKLDSGAVRKVFTLNGNPVMSVSDFANEEVFIAYGVEKFSTDDFDLDQVEFKNVQSIIKSPDLEQKYDKYSSASPKLIRRRKFALFRQGGIVARRKGRASATSKSRDPLINDSNSNNGEEIDYNRGENAYGNDQLMVQAKITEKYDVLNKIGDGNFATVYRCISKRTKREYALKIIDKNKCLGKEQMLASEILVLKVVSHPNIIELLEVFDFSSETCLVTEYISGGDLFDAVSSDTKYSEAVARGMVTDLASALKYLHDNMIVHRDIKPENLLVVDLDTYINVNGTSERLKSLKLGDFGLAQVVEEPLFTVCGTPTYVAPEILAETGYGVKVDVWATGIIMYILLVGYPPFSSRTNNQEELFDQILSGIFEFNSPDWDDVSYSAKELITLMLQVDPLQRYSSYDVLQHQWIKDSP